MVLNIREAVAKDGPKLINLGCKLIDNVMELRSDRKKVNYIVTAAMCSKAHKLLVAEEDGKVVGAMLTATDQFVFAEKMYGYITAIHYLNDIIGRELISYTMDWIESRKAVQLVNYSMPVKTSVDRLLLEQGFEASGSMLVWRRYGRAE